MRQKRKRGGTREGALNGLKSHPLIFCVRRFSHLLLFRPFFRFVSTFFASCPPDVFAPFLSPRFRNLRFTGVAFEVLGYGLYYLSLEPVVGSLWLALVGLPTWVTATWFRAAVPNAWAWAIGLHVLSWVVQIALGHQRFERRKPALLDSFFQSLVLAPLFVTYEVAFWLGYRPAFRRELEQAIREKIQIMQNAQEDDEAKEPLVAR